MAIVMQPTDGIIVGPRGTLERRHFCLQGFSRLISLL